ncbi:hypothetical protein A2U01_0086075, partial [Trifolium medium]|nr:hypothetical protein [Trifolium medium]
MYVSAGPNHVDPVSGRKICVCGRFCDDDDVDDDEDFGGYLNAKSRYYGENLAMVVPSFVWPFVDEMAAKSDDKTL